MRKKRVQASGGAQGFEAARPFQVSEGDLISVQVGMPHQWTEVAEGGVAYLVFHSFPAQYQP